MLRTTTLGLAAFVVVAVLLTLGSGDAEARRKGLVFCNKTRFAKIQVAVAEKVGRGSGKTYKVHGWYNFKRGECGRVISGKLRFKKYYYFAKAKGGNRWYGKYNFCVRSKPFTIVGKQGNCRSKRAVEQLFRKVNVGGSGYFKINLTR